MTSDLATKASRHALEAAGIPAEQIDMIVCATVTGDTVFPATAVWVQQKLGISCPAFDVNAACSGFSYGMTTATAFVTSGMADTVLVIGAEIFSRIIDFTDRGTCILFGDGAGAAVLQRVGVARRRGLGPGRRRQRRRDPVDARPAVRAIRRRRPPWKRASTSCACRTAERSSSGRSPRWRPPAANCWRSPGYSIDDIDVLIPHQANARIMNAVVERLGIDPAKAVVDVAEVGNTSAASIPDRARSRLAQRPDPSGRPGAVHVVRRRAHLGRHARALDDAGAGMTSRVAVVTGASRGIGRACAVALAEAGWTVAVGYRSDEAAAKEAVEALRGRRHARARRLPRHDG